MAGLTFWFMSLRDIGSALIRLAARQRPYADRPSPNPLRRIPVLASVYEQRVGVIGWGLGAGFFAFYLASAARQTADLIQGSPGFRNYLTVAGGGDPYISRTRYLLFWVAPLVVVVYACPPARPCSAGDHAGGRGLVVSAPT